MRGRYLANRVTEPASRAAHPRTPASRNSATSHREQRRLRVLRLVQQRASAALSAAYRQVLVQLRDSTASYAAGEHRERRVQLARPSRPAGCPDR